MSVAGTVIDGHVRLDRAESLPEGVRVRVEVEPTDRDEELAILRQSYEDANAGRTRSAREVLKEIAIRHNLPLEPGE